MALKNFGKYTPDKLQTIRESPEYIHWKQVIDHLANHALVDITPKPCQRAAADAYKQTAQYRAWQKAGH